MAFFDLDQMSPLGDTRESFNMLWIWMPSQTFWLWRPFWEMDSLICEGGCRKGLEPSDKLMVHGKEHPASHRLGPLPKQWFSCFGEINSDDFFCLCYGILSPKRYFLEGELVKDNSWLCCPAMTVRHTEDLSLSFCSHAPKKPSLTHISVKVRGSCWKLSHWGATLLEPVVVMAVNCLG